VSWCGDIAAISRLRDTARHNAVEAGEEFTTESTEDTEEDLSRCEHKKRWLRSLWCNERGLGGQSGIGGFGVLLAGLMSGTEVL
jgi:hypothetical protein